MNEVFRVALIIYGAYLTFGSVFIVCILHATNVSALGCMIIATKVAKITRTLQTQTALRLTLRVLGECLEIESTEDKMAAFTTFQVT